MIFMRNNDTEPNHQEWMHQKAHQCAQGTDCGTKRRQSCEFSVKLIKRKLESFWKA